MLKQVVPVLSATLLVTAGCSQQEVVVVDTSSQPIENAFVEPHAPNLLLPLMRTDSNGSVDIPKMSPPATSVTVGKEGYGSAFDVAIPPRGKTTVVLKRPEP